MLYTNNRSATISSNEDIILDYKSYFKSKKITILGLGLLGRGINVTKFLAECGAELLVTDLKTRVQLAPALKALKKYRNIKFVLSEHKLSDFRNCDMVIKAAGVPLDSPYIAEARKNKISIEMDASLFAKLVPKDVTLIGVTGTRGKSTVTHIIYDMLKTAGKRVYLAGNIRGIATLPLIKKVKAGDYVVMELDSWQLQGFGDAKISPHISVFTNFMRDHQNYYKGNMKKYFSDKANIFKFQKKADYVICGQKVAEKIKSKSRKITAQGSSVPKNWNIKLLGEHNKENIAIAIKMGEALGIKKDIIKKTVENFTGVPGRLECVKKWRGISFYNDTTSTMPDATIAALNSVYSNLIIYDKVGIILIAGGADKELDYKKCVTEIIKKVKYLILFSGTATEKIKHLLPKNYEYAEVKNMKEAVRLARARAKQGDIILLSPGAASFGIFKNEYDRGDQFIKEISLLR